MTRALLVACVLAASGCDDRQAFHEPDPSLGRMLDQRRADPWEASRVFADGKVMQSPPPGTVAVDDHDDDAPPPVTPALLALGRARFDVVCATCHGILGDGESVVASKMLHRPPPSFHEPRIRALGRAELFRVATEGYGLMPGYADVLPARERWAVVSYVAALQLGRNARVADLPPAVRDELLRRAP